VPNLIAVDVAILPPADVSAQAIACNLELPAAAFRGLCLDADHLPHVTLTQQFIRDDRLDVALAAIDSVLAGQPPVRVVVRGGARGGHTVWMAIERTPPLVSLHEQLMEVLMDLEERDGTRAAFADDARDADVAWVSGFRNNSSFARFLPHITLGHSQEPPVIAPFAFEATAVAACHLGRFCTCQRVLRSWTLVETKAR
jgi:hypothetical protein